MQAYKYFVNIDQNGIIQDLKIPELKEKKVEIIVFPMDNDNKDDLVSASQSSTEFWNNNKDDEVWNDL